jgi:LacI family transcriptional regulator
MEGYRQTLQKHGISLDKSLVRECGFTEAAGYAAAKLWLTEGNLPTAIFAANDPAAIGAMAALGEANIRVPEDIAVVGAGNIRYGDLLRVPLTTVSWSTIDMGEVAARLLLESIESTETPQRQNVVIQPRLVVRGSCGSPPAPSK